jgi:ribosomal protein S18 acetylase RimI-like enzyme
MTEAVFGQHFGEQTFAIMDDVTDLYVEIHSGSPEYDYPMYSKASLISRTSDQVRKAGFKLVTAIDGNTLVGFSFGYTFPSGQWWSNSTPPPQEVLESSKFAVIELDVRESHRRQGLGGKLLKNLLEDRPEKYATLAAIPDSLAYGMYVRRGWYKAGLFPKAPIMHAMLIPLNVS